MPFPYWFPITWGELPSVQVLIDGEIPFLVKGSIMVDWRVEERSTAEFIIVDIDGSASYERGQPVQIWDRTDTLIFSGFIDIPESVRMSPAGGLFHRIQCMDNHFLADKRLVIASYSATDAGDIVTDLHTNYLDAEGVTIGAIQTGPEIAEAVFNYTTVAQALDALAEYAGFTWYIDENKALYFIDRTTNAAPWTATTGDMLKWTPIISGGNPLYRNRQYIRGGTALTAAQTEDNIADGTVVAFAMGYPLAKVPVITEDGAPMSVGIKGLDSGEDYYWSKGDNVIYAEVAPLNTVVVRCVYQGLYPIITLTTDEPERIARLAIEGGTGITDHIIDEGYHDTLASSSESGAAKIRQYARNAKKFNFDTVRYGLKAGQLLPVDYALLGLNSTDMLIESVRMRTAGANKITYEITAIVGPAIGSWTKFFSSMIQRQDAILHVGDDYLLALLQESEALALAESVSIDTDDFSGGLVNRWLNAAPIDSGSLGNVQHERFDLAETPSLGSHDTEDYDWDAADAKYSFATWA